MTFCRQNRNSSSFIAVLLASVLFCTVAAAAQQDALTALQAALQADSLFVFNTDTVLRGQSCEVNETVVFINCNGAVDRPVNGSVIILNGELGLRRGARVGGDVFLVRSTVFSSRGAEITGKTVSVASADAVRAVNAASDNRKSGGGFPIHLKMVTNRMGGFRVEGYDRVDGFSVSWGFKLIQPDWDDFSFLSTKIITATTRQQLGFETRLAVPLDSKQRWQVWFGARNLTDTNDRWRLGNLENAIKAFIAGYDHRYYFRREGFSSGVMRRFGRRHSVSLSYLNERFYSLSNESPFTLVGQENFKPNLPVDCGPMHSVLLKGVIDSRNDTYFTLSGTRFKFEGEMAGGAMGGEHSFARYDLSLERWDTFHFKHHTYFWFKFAGADKSLPFQRAYTMGNTLRGHDNFAYSGDRMALLQAAYGYTLPALPVIEYLFLNWQADLIYEAGTAFFHSDPYGDYNDIKRDAGIGFTGSTILGRLRFHLFQDLDKSFRSGRRLTLSLEMTVND